MTKLLAVSHFQNPQHIIYIIFRSPFASRHNNYSKRVDDVRALNESAARMHDATLVVDGEGNGSSSSTPAAMAPTNPKWVG